MYLNYLYVPLRFMTKNFLTGDILCYSCISQGGGDDTCVTNPAAVVNPIVKCQDKKKYCTIRRLENTAEPGKSHSAA